MGLAIRWYRIASPLIKRSLRSSFARILRGRRPRIFTSQAVSGKARCAEVSACEYSARCNAWPLAWPSAWPFCSGPTPGLCCRAPIRCAWGSLSSLYYPNRQTRFWEGLKAVDFLPGLGGGLSIPHADEVGICDWCGLRQVLTLVGICQVCSDIADRQTLDNSASLVERAVLVSPDPRGRRAGNTA